MTTFGCVVLTTGNRPDDLRLALESVLRQQDVDADIVVVGNGWEPVGLPDGVRGLGLAEDRGIPAGRNAGGATLAASCSSSSTTTPRSRNPTR